MSNEVWIGRKKLERYLLIEGRFESLFALFLERHPGKLRNYLFGNINFVLKLLLAG